MYGTYCRLRVGVGASALTVLRAARRKIAKHHRRGRATRAARHEFYRAILREHADARALFARVTRGV